MTCEDSHSTHSPGTHPVLACAETIESSLKSVADVNPAFMTTGEKATALVELTRLGSELESLRLRVIASADDVAETDGSPNVASWLTPRAHTGAAATHQAERLAISLDTRWLVVAEALAKGALNLEQAKVIVAALDRVADADVPPEVLAEAEAHLVELAHKHSPKALRMLGRKILTVVAPEVVDDEERKRVEEEERKAHARARLWFKKNGDGTVELRATMSEAAGARLKSVLNSLTSPRHQNTGDGAAPLVDPATGKKVPFDQRRGLAFEAFLEGLDPDALPVHAGNGTTLVITMELSDLLAGIGVGTLPDGGKMSATQVRRLACTSTLVPAVLDGKGEVLDYGRGKRLFSGPQIAAMGLRDKTCRAEGCPMPAKWCEAHHFTKSWAEGGSTDVKDGKLLCPWHHHRAHDDTYDKTHLPNGDVRFRKRT